MPTRKLFNGMEIPPIGIGTQGDDNIADAVYGAIKAGYRLIDCAQALGNEGMIGLAIARAIDEGIVTRDALFVMSKLPNHMHKKGDVLLAFAKTLRDLGLDYLDMYSTHWPFMEGFVYSRPEYIATWRQMEKLMYMGLVRCLGMSNMTINVADEVLQQCRIRPAALHMESYPAYGQPELAYFCMEKALQPISYNPYGLDVGDDEAAPVSVLEMPEIVTIADSHNIIPAAVCIKWAVQHGQIPIVPLTDEDECAAMFKCISDTQLTSDEMDIIDGLDMWGLPVAHDELLDEELLDEELLDDEIDSWEEDE